jgi:[ribosomal protein S5]-alanine N-acetyltransferase
VKTAAQNNSANSLNDGMESTRLRLRPFSASDIKFDYIAWLNDSNVVRYSNQRFRHHTEHSCRQYLASFIGSNNQFLAIVEKSTVSVIGTLTIYRSLPHQTADIGIMIGAPSAWGNGYGLEAFSIAINTLLQNPDIRKITAGAQAANKGMIKVMERAGLHLEATRYGQEILDGEPVDIVYYSKFRDA